MAEEEAVAEGEESIDEMVSENEEPSTEESEEVDTEDSDESEEEESSEEVTETPEEPAEETYKLNVYGKEIEVDKEQLIALAQKGTAADKNFNDTEKQRQELLGVINDLKDPTKLFPLLNKMGHDTRKITEDYLYEEYQKEKMTDEQKQALDYKTRAEAAERREADGLKEKQSQELLARQEEIREEYDQEFSKALEEVTIPKTKESVAKMAYYMEAGLAEGTQITAKEAATLVQQDMNGYYKELVDKSTPEQLISMFGEGLGKKLSNFDLSKIKSPQDGNKVDVEKTKSTSKGKKKSPKRSEAQIKDFLDAKFGGDPYDD